MPGLQPTRSPGPRGAHSTIPESLRAHPSQPQCRRVDSAARSPSADAVDPTAALSRPPPRALHPVVWAAHKRLAGPKALPALRSLFCLRSSRSSACPALAHVVMASGNAHIGKPAPDFTATAVVDGAFKEIKLSDYRGKYVVLFFYPLDFTFVCPTEIIAFSNHAEDFRKLGCEVLGVSVDSQFTHLAWINTPRKEGGLGPLNIPLLADVTKSLSQNYGVLKNDEGIAYRGLFIIDAKGVLRQITVNDLPVGRSVDEALRLVQAFQYTDEHGEVCPAGWKPGSDTIKPSVDDSKEYFSKHN